MFNLLIKAGGWNKAGNDSLDRERIFEYTEAHVRSQFEKNGHPNTNALQQLSTVLMPETWKNFGDDQLARIVTITGIDLYRDAVALSYEYDMDIPPLPNDTIVERLSSKWGLGRFETTRTHWAIKDVDLYRSLIPILIESVDADTAIPETTPTDLPLDHLRDPSSIEEHLARIDPNDPSQAISSCKSLIEATIKHVLEELGESYHERARFPALMKQVQTSLNVHP